MLTDLQPAEIAGVPVLLGGRRSGGTQPLAIVIAADLGTMLQRHDYSAIARHLQADGFLSLAIDPPAHGADRRDAEAGDLSSWPTRVHEPDGLIRPFVERVGRVLDQLVAERSVDERRIVAIGTSRGAFCALHLAAADSRVKAVAARSPVVDLRDLSEFASVATDPALAELSLESVVPALADRPVWISIGNDDRRVNTDRAIAFARSLARAAQTRPAPVSLRVGISHGHEAPPGRDLEAAEFLRHYSLIEKSEARGA